MKNILRGVLLVFLLSVFFILHSKAQQSNSGNSIPTIFTSPIIKIGLDSAICGGKIINDGGQTITASGICISKTPFPTINDRIIANGATSGEFTTLLNKLYPASAYYVRAYATNASGTAYGVQRTFATDPFKIGQLIYGGTFFYEFKSGDPDFIEGEFHGLVFTAYNIDNKAIIWHNAKDTLTNAVDSTIGNGTANTNTIVNIQGAGNYAASKAFNSNYGGYSDWYLPNLKEMQLLIAFAPSPCNTNCWTSNEYSNSQAIAYVSKKQIIANKSVKYRAVFIRKF